MRVELGRAALGAALGVAVLLAFHALVYPRITDPDAFYHWGHAAEYRSAGITDSTFPWTAYSAIGEVGADLWYGLHVLMVPFADAPDRRDAPANRIRIAAVVLGAAGVALVAVVAVAHGWIAAPLWPVLFLLAVPNALFRYLSIRPEVLSIPLALVLLSGWVRGRRGIVAAASFGMAWIHLSMFWLILGVGIAGTLGVAATGGAWSARGAGRSAGALLVGMVAGALLRPNPLGAIELAWVQIGQLLFEKTGGVPLTFATELAPVGLGAGFAMAWPALLAWFVAVAWVGVRADLVPGGAGDRDGRGRAERSTEERANVAFCFASALLASGFLFLTVVVARRSLVYWTAFAVPTIAVAATEFARRTHRPRILARTLLLATLPLFAWGLHRNDLNARFVAISPDRLGAEATWLRAASAPGDLVFNTHWDAFGPLFARNRTNRYLGGMDPIFQYAADARRYWMFHHLSTGVATAVTCPASDCAPDEVIDVWEAIRGDYGARWVLAERARDARLIEYLDRDARFRRAFEGADGVVFEVAVAVRPIDDAPESERAREGTGSS